MVAIENEPIPKRIGLLFKNSLNYLIKASNFCKPDNHIFLPWGLTDHHHLMYQIINNHIIKVIYQTEGEALENLILVHLLSLNKTH